MRQRGGSVHCIVNSWENHRIVELAERTGATWSTGFYWYSFAGRPRSLLHVLQMLWDVARTSAGLARVAVRFGPTHVLVPEYAAVLRNAPILAALKLLGVDVVFRMANAPERGRIHDVLVAPRAAAVRDALRAELAVQLRAAAGDGRSRGQDHADSERASAGGRCSRRPTRRSCVSPRRVRRSSPSARSRRSRAPI